MTRSWIVAAGMTAALALFVLGGNSARAPARAAAPTPRPCSSGRNMSTRPSSPNTGRFFARRRKPRSSPMKTKPSPKCAPASNPTSWAPAITNSRAGRKRNCCSPSTRPSSRTGTRSRPRCAICRAFPPAPARSGSCRIIGATPPSPIAPIWRPNMSGMNRGTSCSIRNTRAGSPCSKASTTRFRSSRG